MFGSRSSTIFVITIMNILVTLQDLLSHLLLIDVTELSVVPFILCMEVPQKDQLVPERLKPQRILPSLLLDNVSCSIAQINLIILSWVNSSKEMPHVDAGSVSMSSTESNLKYFPLLPNKFKPFNRPLKRSKKDSSSKESIFQLSILATVSLQ